MRLACVHLPDESTAEGVPRNQIVEFDGREVRRNRRRYPCTLKIAPRALFELLVTSPDEENA